MDLAKREVRIKCPENGETNAEVESIATATIATIKHLESIISESGCGPLKSAAGMSWLAKKSVQKVVRCFRISTNHA